MNLRVSEATILDEVIEDFIAGRADFARFVEGVEHQLARHPELTEATLLWLESLRRGGKLSPGLHALMAEVIERGSSGDITPSFGEEDTLQQVSAAIGAARSESRAPAKPAAPPSDNVPTMDAGPTVVPVPAKAKPVPAKATPAKATSAKATPAKIVPAQPAPGDEFVPAEEHDVAEPHTPEPQSPSVGSLVAGRYRLKALLARGGMSLVYRAEDTQRSGSRADVAVKVVAPAFVGRSSRRELEREGSLLAELDHPGVVRLLDHGQHGENAYLVMELLDGERLRDVLIGRRPHGLPVDQVVQVTRDLADAVAYLHRRGLVHRDIKPANILITASGEVRLIDFGLSAASGDAVVPTGFNSLAGLSPRAPKAFTPLYASPEMLLGAPPDPRDDVYGLGCVVYEMLTGRPPWGKLPADEAAHRKLTASRPTGLSAARWAVLRSAIAFRAAERPADAGAFLSAFFAPRRASRTWGLAAAILVGVAFGIALLPFGPESPTSPDTPASIPVVILEPPAESPLEGPESQAQDETPTSAGVEGEATPILPPPDDRAEVAATEPAPAEAPGSTGTSAPDAASREPPPAAASIAQEARPVPRQEPAPAPTAPRAATATPATPPATVPRSPPVLSFTADRYRVMKTGSALRLELRRPARFEGPLRARWRTVDQTAREGRHFIGSPAWQYTESALDAPALVIFIPIVQDSIPAPDRTFYVELGEVPGGPPLGSPTRAEVTIVSGQ
jgi:serine/threonine protein kinase